MCSAPQNPGRAGRSARGGRLPQSSRRSRSTMICRIELGSRESATGMCFETKPPRALLLQHRRRSRCHRVADACALQRFWAYREQHFRIVPASVDRLRPLRDGHGPGLGDPRRASKMASWRCGGDSLLETRAARSTSQVVPWMRCGARQRRKGIGIAARRIVAAFAHGFANAIRGGKLNPWHPNRRTGARPQTLAGYQDSPTDPGADPDTALMPGAGRRPRGLPAAVREANAGVVARFAAGFVGSSRARTS